MERSACSALNPRDRRNPVRYAVEGYGVLSCVIGGIIDKICISVTAESISRYVARRIRLKIAQWSFPSIFPLLARSFDRSANRRATKSETWARSVRWKAL